MEEWWGFLKKRRTFYSQSSARLRDVRDGKNEIQQMREKLDQRESKAAKCEHLNGMCLSRYR